jgi:hypothetical protein
MVAQRSVISSLVVAGSLAACSGELTAPTPALAPVSSERASLTSHVQSSTQITIVDEDGTYWTLDLARREIRFGSEVLFLEPDQVEDAAVAFRGTVDGDQTANTLGSLQLSDIHSPDPDPDDPNDPGNEEECQPNPWGEGGCWETFKVPGRHSRSRVVDRVNPRRAESLGRDPVMLVGGGGPFTPTIAAPIASAPARRPGLSGLKGPVVNMTSSQFDICADIVNAGHEGVLQYKTNRTRFLKEAIPFAVQEMVNGIMGWKLPPGSGAYTYFANLVADHTQARIRVGFLAAMWNSYGCAYKTVYAGPITVKSLGGSGGPTSTQDLVCTIESGWVSFDGGVTKYDIYVKVCRWES